MSYSYTFTGESSATNLTSDFFLQNYYKHNRNAIKVSVRKEYNQCELSYEDSLALKRAAAKLGSFSYTEEDNGENMVNSILAFADTYNNAIESTSSTDSDTYRQNRQLKALSQKYEEELEDLGITIEKDGTLSVNENLLRSASYDEAKTLFGDDASYIKNIRNIARRINTNSYEEIYTYMTGNGGRLNITL